MTSTHSASARAMVSWNIKHGNWDLFCVGNVAFKDTALPSDMLLSLDVAQHCILGNLGNPQKAVLESVDKAADNIEASLSAQSAAFVGRTAGILVRAVLARAAASVGRAEGVPIEFRAVVFVGPHGDPDDEVEEFERVAEAEQVMMRGGRGETVLTFNPTNGAMNASSIPLRSIHTLAFFENVYSRYARPDARDPKPLAVCAFWDSDPIAVGDVPLAVRGWIARYVLDSTAGALDGLGCKEPCLVSADLTVSSMGNPVVELAYMSAAVMALQSTAIKAKKLQTLVAGVKDFPEFDDVTLALANKSDLMEKQRVAVRCCAKWIKLAKENIPADVTPLIVVVRDFCKPFVLVYDASQLMALAAHDTVDA